MSTAWKPPQGQSVHTISSEETAMNTTRAHATHQPCSAVAKALPARVTSSSAHILALCVLALGVLLLPLSLGTCTQRTAAHMLSVTQDYFIGSAVPNFPGMGGLLSV
jgi:hypothetical protein